MCGGDVTGSAPSFEEMGVAIKQIIAEESRCDDDDQEEGSDDDNTSLSPEHQQLMTWAWLNIKVRHATADASTRSSLVAVEQRSAWRAGSAQRLHG